MKFSKNFGWGSSAWSKRGSKTATKKSYFQEKLERMHVNENTAITGLM